MFRNRKEDENGFNTNENGMEGSLFSGGSPAESATVLPAQPTAPSAYVPAQPGQQAQPSAPGAPASPAGSVPTTGSYQMNASARPANEPTRPQPLTSAANSPFRAAPAQPEAPRARPVEAPRTFGTPAAGAERKDTRRVLTVGTDILLKGEIAACDRLLIEGKVDAVLNDVGTVELTESGSFKGIANVENAEISGVFEGELVASGRIVIYASGRVSGKITYGEIEIERGGELTGEIKTIGSAKTKPARKEDKVAA